LLDANAITYGLLTAPSFLGTDNSYLLAGLDTAKGRLRGTVIVDPRTSRAELVEMAARGASGVRLNLFRKPERDVPDLSAPDYGALFTACAELGWHVEIYDEGPRLVRWLPQIMQTGVRVVVDHFGSPDPVAQVDCPGFRTVLSGVASGRLWVKLSAPYRVGGNALAARYAQHLLAEGGAQRLVWGSDWPWTQNEAGQSYRRCLESLEEWVPDAAARATILGETPLELFGFKAAQR
jgi:predicted TIM-barrel fold metal-dependent hydrolase